MPTISPYILRNPIACTLNRVAASGRLLLLVFLCLGGTATLSLADQYLPRHRVLLVNSYHPGYPWSDGISSAIGGGLARADSTIDFAVEYLDAIRFNPDQLAPAAEAFLFNKYQQLQPDVLIVADDAALRFILPRRDRLFPGVPMVFCGINNLPEGLLLEQKRITGVVEDIDMTGLIDLILRLHPRAGQIAFIADSTVTGHINRQRFLQASLPFRSRINFVELADLTLAEFAAALRELPADTVILHTFVTRDRDGATLAAQGSLALITENSDLPFYSLWEHGIGDHGVGGIITSPSLQGEAATAIALRILHGEDPADIPVLRDVPVRPVFNYPVLQRYGIDEKLLPPGSVVRNRPSSLYRDHTVLFWVVLTGFLLLFFLVAALLSNMLKRRQAMILLKSRKNQLQQIIESMPVGVFLTDLHGQIVMGNSAGVKIWGGERKVGIEKYGIYKGWWADSGRPLAAGDWGMARAIRSGETSLDELIDIESFDGERKTITHSAMPLRDVDGVIIGGLVVIQDVTERLRAERTLQALANEWQNTFNAVRDAIFILDKNYCVLHCNQAFAQLVEKEPRAIIGLHCWELVHHCNSPITGCPLARMLESTQSESSECQEGERWFETRVDPILDDDGKLYGAIHIIADITKRKLAEEHLAERERTLHLLFDEMQSGFALHEIICDTEGLPHDYRFLMINPSFEAMTGLRAADIVGKTVREVHPRVKSIWIERYGRVALTGESAQFESYVRRLDRYFGIRAYCPEPGKFAVLISDVTERRRGELALENLLEQLEQRNTELEQFSYSVSHDLKTPLVTIGGFVGQLRDDLQSGNHDSLGVDLDFIESSTVQMGTLLDNLLQLARSGRVISDPRPVNLARTVREATNLINGVLDHCTVRIDLADDLPMVPGDAERLREVIQNLVENAAKFSRNQPRPEIEIGGRAEDGRVVLWVRDNGIGIPPQYLEKIFGLFERLDRSEEGTGIGLAMAKRIVEKHGGKLWAESGGEGQGSTFYVVLPGIPPAPLA